MDKSCGLILATAILAVGASGSFADAPGDKAKTQRGNPEAVFKRIDTNGDGKISKDEFKAFIDKATRGKTQRPELIDKLFGRLDTDGDGFLSLDEFKRLRDLREKLVEKKKAKKGSEAGASSE